MRPGLIQALLRLYPPWWCARYEPEFTALLEEMPCSITCLLDIAVCAISARLSSFAEETMVHPVKRALPASFMAWLLAVAAGINLVASVDDNPMVAAMQSHVAWMNSWRLIEAGSVFGLAAVLAAGMPLLVRLFRQAQGARRYMLLTWSAVLPAIVLLWVGAVLLATGGHWVPLPWAITGDWMAPPNWPSLATRWILGITTLVLLLAVALSSALGFRRAVRMAALPSLMQGRSVARLSVVVLAVSALLMAVGAGLWGWFAERYAAGVFHARLGGLIGLSTSSSWLMSFILFVAAALFAMQGARRYQEAAYFDGAGI